tara:strand:- start:336 stop:1349 length:1014 start_codon:yes stop_codon:yes gene_type:complete
MINNFTAPLDGLNTSETSDPLVMNHAVSNPAPQPEGTDAQARIDALRAGIAANGHPGAVIGKSLRSLYDRYCSTPSPLHELICQAIKEKNVSKTERYLKDYLMENGEFISDDDNNPGVIVTKMIVETRDLDFCEAVAKETKVLFRQVDVFKWLSEIAESDPTNDNNLMRLVNIIDFSSYFDNLSIATHICNTLKKVAGKVEAETFDAIFKVLVNGWHNLLLALNAESKWHRDGKSSKSNTRFNNKITEYLKISELLYDDDLFTLYKKHYPESEIMKTLPDSKKSMEPVLLKLKLSVDSATLKENIGRLIIATLVAGVATCCLCKGQDEEVRERPRPQ